MDIFENILADDEISTQHGVLTYNGNVLKQSIESEYDKALSADLGHSENQELSRRASEHLQADGFGLQADGFGLHEKKFDPLGISRFYANSSSRKSQISRVTLELEKFEKTKDRSAKPHIGAIGDFLEQGIRHVWTEDSAYQREVLQQVFQQVRHMPNEMIEVYLDVCQRNGIFANFQEWYLVDLYGEDIYSQEFGLYTSNQIDKYSNRILIPLRFLNDEICGFIGYSPLASNSDGTCPKYIYPNAAVIQKAMIMYCTTGGYVKAIRDGYVCITDGLFDAITLNALGINALSLCGSALTKYHKLFLSKIQHKIVIPDNDAAGTKLLELLQHNCSNVSAIYRESSKDIDDYLKDTQNREEFLTRFHRWRLQNFLGSLYFKNCSERKSSDIAKYEKPCRSNTGTLEPLISSLGVSKRLRESATEFVNEAGDTIHIVKPTDSDFVNAIHALVNWSHD